MLESMWKKSNCGERDTASAIARCGASKIEISWMDATPMPVSFLNSSIAGCIGTIFTGFLTGPMMGGGSLTMIALFLCIALFMMGFVYGPLGAFLPSLFYTHNYWIDDYVDFDLDDPPPGTVWVRYGSDALLIDEYTGEVIQVVFGIFY